ncbi:MAG TPA: pyruvate dehydrogenase complex dihydrolipoamide acetyltransferase, partial [Flavobacteriaceae bacterium]|nr:pyruvate dehydrogenase complex dihydrolipoamide acetyltransferase [Flavobacteriaceae bacterium]
MAEIITMPRLSDTMTEGVVAQWLKKVGDKVTEGDILAEIETDKATMEFESFYEGTLLHIGLQDGESAPVDSLLAVIGEEGEDISGILKDFKAPKSSDNSKEEKEEPAKQDNKAKTEEKETSKEPETKQPEPAFEPSTQTTDGKVIASPLARKIAEEKGINLAQVKGTGENGRIVKRDVENFTPSAMPSSGATAPTMATAEESFEDTNNSQMRKTIARRLAESKFTAPHYYLMIEIDMDNAIASRKAINEIPDTKISFNDIVVKASAMALKKHPKVNSQWFDDKTRINHHIHIGVAVAIDEGLVVPVLPFTDKMSMTEIGSNVKDLAVKARSKKLTPNEMEGSTFTVSNLGMFGISEFTSIINQPNSAILSVGAIVEKPVVKNGEVVPGNVMKVTLACDHRTVDGATGAAFLQTLKQFIENPVTM